MELAQANPSWHLDRHAWELVAPNGKRLRLTAGERALLLTVSNRSLVSSHELTASLARYSPAHASAKPPRVATFLCRLRAKVQDATGLSLPIHAVRGMGYGLSEPIGGTPEK
jgi:DNA-binding response OmpR family regulator